MLKNHFCSLQADLDTAENTKVFLVVIYLGIELTSLHKYRIGSFYERIYQKNQ